MNLPSLLFGVGFQIFFYSDASNVYVENVRGYLLLQPKDNMTAIWVVLGHSAVIPKIEK